VLAYVFWHGPRAAGASEEYERALIAFHRSLARSLPVGTRATASFRIGSPPWRGAGPVAADAALLADGGYEDWYLLDDFAALGVLNEAAVGRGHRSLHDAAAHRSGAGAGGLYALVEGEPCAQALGDAKLASWIARPGGSTQRALGELLGDGMEPEHASLWRRQMNLGPAPEFCLLARELSAGVGDARLPAGWSATTLARDVVWSG